ncbi:hypothetical protein ACRAWC_01630 [Leifsonia sp. L25]|uniref:hypothetical protein n=1 Tax=Actinomycetes TaxID=1760 RepID=UPI003D695EC3
MGLIVIALAELGVWVLKLIRPILPYLLILGLIFWVVSSAIKYWWITACVVGGIVLLVLLYHLATRKSRKRAREAQRRRAAERAVRTAGVLSEDQRLKEAAKQRAAFEARKRQEQAEAWAQYEAATTEVEKAEARDRFTRAALSEPPLA